LAAAGAVLGSTAAAAVSLGTEGLVAFAELTAAESSVSEPVVAGALALAAAVAAGASTGARGVIVLVAESNGRSMIQFVGGLPGTILWYSNCELDALPFGLNCSPAPSCGVKLWPTPTGALPSDRTTVPFLGTAVISIVSREDASLGTVIISGIPSTDL